MALTPEKYNYYKKMYEVSAGDPKAQRQFVLDMYTEASQPSMDQVMASIFGEQPAQSLPQGGYNYVNQTPSVPAPTQATPMPEEEGTFGFGTGKGQLFGEGGLVSAVTQPFRQGIMAPALNIASAGGNVLGNLLSGQDLGQAITNPNADINSQDGARVLLQGIDQALGKGNMVSDFLQATSLPTIQENQDYMQNPVAGGFKGGMGLLSYAIPGGSGVGQSAVRGGLSGALFGAGTARPGEELERGVGSGLMGGATSAAVSLLGKLSSKTPASKAIGAISDDVYNQRLNDITQTTQGTQRTQALQNLIDEIPANHPLRESILKVADLEGVAPKTNLLTRTGKNIRGQVFDVPLDKYVKTPQARDKLINEGLRIIDDMGGSTATPDAAARSLADRAKTLSDDLATGLSSSKATVSTTRLSDKFTNKLQKLHPSSSTSIIEQPEVQDYILRLASLGDDAPASQINALKFELQNKLVDVYSKRAVGGNPLMTSTKTGLEVLRDVLDDSLKSHPQLTSYKGIMGDLSTINKLQPYVAKAANKSGTFSSPALLKGVEVPNFGIPSRIRNIGGRAVEGAGNLASKAPNINMSPLIQGGMQVASNPALQKFMLPGLLNMTGNEPSQTNQTQILPSMGTLADASMTQLYPFTSTNMGLPPGGDMINDLKQALAITYALTGEMNLDAVLKLMDKMGTQGGKRKALPEKQQQFMNAADSAQRALQMLETGNVATGPTQGIVGGIQNLFGTKSDEQTDFESTLAAARGLAVNALSGANVPPSEYERIANLIPQGDEHPNRAIQKLKSFIREMNSFANVDYAAQ